MRNGVLSYRLLHYNRRLIAGCCVGKGSGAVQRAPQTIQQPTDGPRTNRMRVCPRAKHVMIFLFWMGTSNAAEYHDAGLVAASAWTSRAGAAPCGMIAPILVLGVLIFAPRNMRRCKRVWKRNWATHPRACVQQLLRHHVNRASKCYAPNLGRPLQTLQPETMPTLMQTEFRWKRGSGSNDAARVPSKSGVQNSDWQKQREC